jgi:hypothetical protein
MAVRQHQEESLIRHFQPVKINEDLGRIWAENALSPYLACKMGRQIVTE